MGVGVWWAVVVSQNNNHTNPYKPQVTYPPFDATQTISTIDKAVVSVLLMR